MWRVLDFIVATSILFAVGGGAQSASLNPSPDKSGTGPKSVSLPAGPGSIRGFGASYAWRVPGNKGASRYELEVWMPEGPSGQVPKISVVYGSDLGMGALGLGWRLSLPHVERDTVERLPIYDEPYLHDVFPASLETFRSEAGEKLVEVDSGFYFAEHESRFIRYRRLREGWEASMPDGSRLYLGVQPQARLMDRYGTSVFRWLPDRTVDPHGNEIRYFYRESGSREGAFVSAKYLSRIEYGPGPGPWTAFYVVHFDYEERPDKVLDGTPGFLVENHLRLVAIEVLAQGTPRSKQAVVMDRNGDGIDEQLIRRYRFRYKPKDRFTALSLVESVTETGRDGKLSLPSVTFDYSAPGEAADGPVSLRSSTFVGDATDLGPVSDSSVELVDLNSDALPDLLMTPGQFGWPHRALLNLGVNNAPGSPSAMRLSRVRELSGSADVETVTLAAGAQDAALADFNGDGRVDLGYQSVVHELHYFPGTGEVGWGERRRFGSDSSVPQRFPGSGSPTFQVDLDGDRRIDLAQTSPDGLDLTVWFCLDTGYSDPVTWDCPEHCDFRDVTTRLADMTGDGQPDLVWIGEGGVRAAPGVGFGRFDPSVREFPFPSGGFISHQELTESRLVDVTGDGLSDLVIGQGTDELRVAVNQGGVALSDWIVFVDVPPRSFLDAKVRWADMNGNGSADYVVLDDSDGKSTVGFADLLMAMDVAPKPNLLTRVDNGLGSVTAIEYVNATEQMVADRIAGHAWDTTHPFPVAVVDYVSEHTYPHREPSTIRYRYRNGIYALAMHENRGFAQVREIEEGQIDQHPTLVIETHFNRGDRFAALKAKPWRRRLLDAEDRVWEETTTVWSDPPRALHASGGVPVVHFAHPVESTRRISDLGPAPDALLKERFEYDDWGNLVRHEEHGRVDPAGAGPAAMNRRTRLVDYVIDRERWMLRARARERLLDEAGNLVTRTDYHYDDEGFDASRHGTISRGNLTMVRRWRGPVPQESGSASASPPADELVTETRNRHDAFGNILVALGPLATLGPNGNPVDASGHLVRYAYDSRFRSRPVRETFVESDSKQFVHSFKYDEGFGALTLHQSQNGAVSRYRHDALGRLTEIVRPGDTSEFPSIRYRYVPGHVQEDGGRVSWIETQLLDAPPESGEAGSARELVADEHYFRSWRFLDGRGRALYTKHEGGESADGGEGPVMVGVALFTRRGKLASSLAPCLSTLEIGGNRDPFAWENPFEPTWRCDSYYGGRWHRLGHASTPQTKRRYDVLGREVESENPDGTRRRIRYGPLLRMHEDENVVARVSGAPIRYHDDGLGRLVAISEHPRLHPPARSSQARKEWRTTFQYDAADRMTGFVNAKGEQRIVVYDGLGRVARISDPAFGVHKFAHDAASNVLASTDSEGRTARYAYDGLNRLVSEVHSQLGRDETIRVAYEYDTTANGVGRLGLVTDEAGSLELDYDIRGRVTSKTRRFAPAFGGGTFSMSQTYDALDRIISSTYSDGDRATMHYNARNLPHSIKLSSIGDVVTSVVYRPDEQPREVVFGNETVRRHTYDRRGRLTRTELTGARSNTMLFREELSFDPTSNVVLRDRRTIGQSLGFDWSLRELFEHDDLHRLKSVSYEPPLASGVSRRTYGFDPIGDMLSASRELHEDKSGNRSVVVETYSPTNRETTGRVTHLDGYSLSWGPQGRLMTATGPTSRIAYSYDYDGKRIVRRSTQDNLSNPNMSNERVDIFPFPDYEEGGDLGSKLIRFHGAPIARINTSITPGASSASSGHLYFHTDHLGSPVLVVDAKGSVSGIRVLFPFGGTADQRGQVLLRGIIGVQREVELDLAVFDARYLHEATGRFLSPDPILLHVSEPPATPQALNAFSYAMNRPLTHIDPDGRIALLAAAGVAVAVAGAFGTGYSIGSMANATYDRAVGNISWGQYGKTMALNGAGLFPYVKFAQLGKGLALTATNLVKPSTVRQTGRVWQSTTKRMSRVRTVERTSPRNLREQLALDEAMKGAGGPMKNIKMKDPRYPSDTIQKMRYHHKKLGHHRKSPARGPDGPTTDKGIGLPEEKGIEIHYMRNTKTGELFGFKFK